MLVYFHRNPKTLDIFYIGIGNEARPYNFYISGRNVHWHRYVKKYGKPVVQIVHNELTQKEACKWETFYISLFGIMNEGGVLVNMTYGGELSPMSTKSVAKIVHDKLRGRKRPDMKVNNPSRKPENRERSRKAMSEVVRFMKTEDGERRRMEKTMKRMLFDNPMSNPEIKERSISKTRKPIYMICRHTDEVIIKFKGQNDAARFLGKCNAGKINIALSNGKVLYGFKWQYVA